MKKYYLPNLLVALTLAAVLGCNAEVIQTSTIRTTGTKRVADPGDMQLVHVPLGVTSVTVAFLASRADNVEESTSTSFGTFQFGGGGTSEASPMPRLIDGQTYAAGRVLIELRPAKGPGVLLESTQSIVADNSRPLQIDVGTYAPVEGGANHNSLWGHGKVGDAW